MILRKYMSLLGIGSARIDLILPLETYHQGDEINGYFLIKGGTIEQQIKRIECDLVQTDHLHQERVVDTATILTKKQISSEEFDSVLFSFKLPNDIPISSGCLTYHFKTKLTFTKGIESMDHDTIIIKELRSELD